VQLQIEVQQVFRRWGRRARGEAQVDEPAHDAAALVRNADEQAQLFARVARRHGQHELVGALGD